MERRTQTSLLECLLEHKLDMEGGKSLVSAPTHMQVFYLKISLEKYLASSYSTTYRGILTLILAFGRQKFAGRLRALDESRGC